RRKFSHDSLENKKCKSWIKKVPNDDSSYFCIPCNKTFSCSSGVFKHAESKAHRTNMVNNCSDDVNIIEKEPRERKFCHSWLENEQFKPWLQTIPNDPFNCFRSFCNLKLRCGFDKLMRHSDSKKHVSECQKRGFSVDLNTHDEEPVPFEDRKKIARIKFAALIAEENIPFKTAESILSFFQDFGEDPEVLKSMRMNRNKAPKELSALVANAACSAIPEACEELLRKVASFISSSPKRAYIFEQFQKSFCFDETKVHLLQAAAENLLKTVLKNVVKAPLLNFVSMGAINLLLACNRLSADQVMVGEACQDLLDRLNQEGQSKIVKSVYDNCLAFYDIAAKEIRNKLFVKDEFLSKLRIFEPKFALQQEDEKNSPNNSVQDVLFVAQRFGGFDEEILKEEWQFLKKDFTSERKMTIINLHFDEAWKTIMTTKKANGKFRYPVLTKLINAIRSIPNSNADAERVFSVLTDVKSKKRNKLHPSNVQSLCVFKSILRARGETAQTMIVDARYLTLMSENLYKTNARENTCFCVCLVLMNIPLRPRICN
ncbi:hypothetical protein ALC57_04972, partial [Trachymyrmex cornetzi]